MTVYLGFDVLDFMAPNRSGDIRKATARKVVVSGPEHGIRSAYSPTLQPVDALPVSWIASGTAQIEAMLSFIAARKGRVFPVWVPSGQQDLLPTEASSSLLTFSTFGYSEMMFPAYLNRRNIVIYPSVGSPVCASITQAADNEDGTETVDTSEDLSALSGAIVSAKVSFLLLCRLASDEVEIKWESNTVSQCTMRFVEVPQNEIPPPIDHSGEFPGVVE